MRWKRVQLELMIVAATLLLLGTRAPADEEPSARAVLPPPLPPTLKESSTLQTRTDKRTPAPQHSRPKSTRAMPGFDRSKTTHASVTSRAASIAHGDRSRDASAQRRVLATVKGANFRRLRALASAQKRGRDRTPVGPETGHLSPPSDASTSWAEDGPLARIEPPGGPAPHYPGPYGYPPAIPYYWPPPGPE